MVISSAKMSRAFSRDLRLGAGLVLDGVRAARPAQEGGEEAEVVILARDWRALVAWARGARRLCSMCEAISARVFPFPGPVAGAVMPVVVDVPVGPSNGEGCSW